MRCVYERNDHLKAEFQEALDQLNTHGSTSRNSRPSSYRVAVSAEKDASFHSDDEQTSD